ncbi:MAG: hypothetical protein IJF07_07380 [Lachnospiraceae bacterium]|nr:hypothetical protein [Lachnospiraceae bacterium]
MARFTQDIRLNHSYDHVYTIISEFLHSKHFSMSDWQGEPAYTTIEQDRYFKWSFTNGTLHLEAWIKGAFDAEMDLDGISNSALRKAYKEDIDALIKHLQRPGHGGLDCAVDTSYVSDTFSSTYGGSSYDDSRQDYGGSSYDSSGQDYGSNSYNNSRQDYGGSSYDSSRQDYGSSSYNSTRQDYGNSSYDSTRQDYGSSSYNSTRQNYGDTSYDNSPHASVQDTHNSTPVSIGTTYHSQRRNTSASSHSEPNMAAQQSLIYGILSLFFSMSFVFAVIFGALGISRAKLGINSENAKQAKIGRTLSILGISFSCIGIVFYIVFFIFTFFIAEFA